MARSVAEIEAELVEMGYAAEEMKDAQYMVALPRGSMATATYREMVKYWDSMLMYYRGLVNMMKKHIAGAKVENSDIPKQPELPESIIQLHVKNNSWPECRRWTGGGATHYTENDIEYIWSRMQMLTTEMEQARPQRLIADPGAFLERARSLGLERCEAVFRAEAVREA